MTKTELLQRLAAISHSLLPTQRRRIEALIEDIELDGVLDVQQPPATQNVSHDTARIEFLEDICGRLTHNRGVVLDWMPKIGNYGPGYRVRWHRQICDPHPTLRAAIDAERKKSNQSNEGESHG